MAGHFICQTGTCCLNQDICYFAFGSNLNHYRLHQRIGDYRKVGIGYLADHKLAFNKRGGDDSGKCTVISSPENKVWGVICRITREQKEQLDYFEGVGHGYDAVIKKIATSGKIIDAVLYQAQLDAMDDGLMPFDWYKEFVLTGAKYHRLPDEHIKTIDQVVTIADADLARVELNRKILSGIYSEQY